MGIITINDLEDLEYGMLKRKTIFKNKQFEIDQKRLVYCISFIITLILIKIFF